MSYNNFNLLFKPQKFINYILIFTFIFIIFARQYIILHIKLY